MKTILLFFEVLRSLKLLENIEKIMKNSSNQKIKIITEQWMSGNEKKKNQQSDKSINNQQHSNMHFLSLNLTQSQHKTSDNLNL